MLKYKFRYLHQTPYSSLQWFQVCKRVSHPYIWNPYYYVRPTHSLVPVTYEFPQIWTSWETNT